MILRRTNKVQVHPDDHADNRKKNTNKSRFTHVRVATRAQRHCESYFETPRLFNFM